MDEEIGNPKREAGLVPDRGIPELEGPDINHYGDEASELWVLVALPLLGRVH